MTKCIYCGRNLPEIHAALKSKDRLIETLHGQLNDSEERVTHRNDDLAKAERQIEEQGRRIGEFVDANMDLHENTIELSEIVGIARELILFVRDKYGVTSLDGFTCPIHRRLAEALGITFPVAETVVEPTPEAA